MSTTKIYQIEVTEKDKKGHTFSSTMLYRNLKKALSTYKSMIEDERDRGFKIYEHKCTENHYFCFSDEFKNKKVRITLSQKKVY